HVGPAGESVLAVPDTLAVPQKDKFVHPGALPTSRRPRQTGRPHTGVIYAAPRGCRVTGRRRLRLCSLQSRKRQTGHFFGPCLRRKSATTDSAVASFWNFRPSFFACAIISSRLLPGFSVQ